MWLVLCGANDLSALWAARGLECRGLQPMAIVTAEALMYNRRFVHRISTSGASVHITLADEREIDGSVVHGTLNRLQLLPSAHLRHAGIRDRQYAEQELYASTLSWLYALPGKMLNRPTPQGLSGEWRHPSEWFQLATQAGLLSRPYRQSDAQEWHSVSAPPTCTCVIVGGVCCGPTIPPSVATGCIRLAKLSKTELLGIDFHITEAGDWMFSHATPLPDLRSGGEGLLDTLAEALQS